MTRVKIAAMALSVVFCISAFTAPGAFAEGVKKGELVNKEGKALVKNKFKGTTGETVIETAKASVKCTKAAIEGVMSGTTSATQTITFSGCKSSTGTKCKTEGSAEGVVIFSGVSREFDWSRTSPRRRRLLWFTSILRDPVFFCGEVRQEVRGDFLSTELGAAQEETLLTTYTITTKQSGGKQEQTEYENSAEELVKVTLEASFTGAFETAGESAVEHLQFEEQAELI